MTRPSIIGLVCVALCALGCKPKISNREKWERGVDGLVAKHKPTLAKTLDALRTCQEAARKRPALRTLTAAPPSVEGSVFFGENTKLDEYYRDAAGDEACSPLYEANEPFAIAGGFHPKWPDNELEPRDKDFAELESKLRRAENIPYAIICRSLAVTRPTEAAAKTFEGGDYSGECRVFATNGCEYLGGVPIQVKMHSATTRAYRSLDDALADAIKDAVTSALQPLGKVRPTFFCSFPAK